MWAWETLGRMMNRGLAALRETGNINSFLQSHVVNLPKREEVIIYCFFLKKYYFKEIIDSLLQEGSLFSKLCCRSQLTPLVWYKNLFLF